MILLILALFNSTGICSKISSIFSLHSTEKSQTSSQLLFLVPKNTKVTVWLFFKRLHIIEPLRIWKPIMFLCAHICTSTSCHFQGLAILWHHLHGLQEWRPRKNVVIWFLWQHWNFTSKLQGKSVWNRACAWHIFCLKPPGSLKISPQIFQLTFRSLTVLVYWKS